MIEHSRPLRLTATDDLEDRVAAVLADPAFADHPLQSLLQELMDRLSGHVQRLERITQISDRYQSDVQAGLQSLSQRYDRQIRRLEKVIRISDRYQSRLYELNRALEEASTHDQLTGLPNRKLMAEFCRREDERVRREGITYSLLAIDADHFKAINDTHGHETGDHVLCALARCFRGSMRDGDSCARWGGEEFLALLCGADIQRGRGVAERLLNSVRSLELPVRGSTLSPQVSIGLAQQLPGETYTEVYRRADAALLLAKKEGRNRCVVASPSPA